MAGAHRSAGDVIRPSEMAIAVVVVGLTCWGRRNVKKIRRKQKDEEKMKFMKSVINANRLKIIAKRGPEDFMLTCPKRKKYHCGWGGGGYCFPAKI
jgi:hypothetical protein